MATISTHIALKSLWPSIELCNTSDGKSAAAFQRDSFKLSILGGLFLQHLFYGRNWSFQQDSAPANKAQTTQQWLETNIPDFISTSDWSSASPDLSPLDYKLWSRLQEMACKKRHPNIESLKQSLRKAAADFPVDVLRDSIEEWPQRLKDCVRSNGGYFE